MAFQGSDIIFYGVVCGDWAVVAGPVHVPGCPDLCLRGEHAEQKPGQRGRNVVHCVLVDAKCDDSRKVFCQYH